METKEKNLEQDIESWLLNEGGYVKGMMATSTRQSRHYWSTMTIKRIIIKNKDEDFIIRTKKQYSVIGNKRLPSLAEKLARYFLYSPIHQLSY